MNQDTREAFEKWHSSPEYRAVPTATRGEYAEAAFAAGAAWQASAEHSASQWIPVENEFREMLMEVMQAIEGRWMEGYMSPSAYAAVIVRANGLLNRDVPRAQPAPPAPPQSRCADNDPERDCKCGGERGKSTCMFPDQPAAPQSSTEQQISYTNIPQRQFQHDLSVTEPTEKENKSAMHRQDLHSGDGARSDISSVSLADSTAGESKSLRDSTPATEPGSAEWSLDDGKRNREGYPACEIIEPPTYTQASELDADQWDAEHNAERCPTCLSDSRKEGNMVPCRDKFHGAERVGEADWRKMCIVEIAVENQSVRDYVEHWEGCTLTAEQHISELEAQLSTARQEITRVRPLADCYERILQTLGIEKDVLGYVKQARQDADNLRAKLEAAGVQ